MASFEEKLAALEQALAESEIETQSASMPTLESTKQTVSDAGNKIMEYPRTLATIVLTLIAGIILYLSKPQFVMDKKTLNVQKLVIYTGVIGAAGAIALAIDYKYFGLFPQL